MKNPLHVAISGINATDNPGPGVGVARSLKELGEFELIGLSYDVHDPGNYMSDLFKNSYLISYPTKGWAGMLSGLKSVQKKSGLDVLIPCLDAELPLLIRKKDELAALGIKTLLPNTSQFELRNKSKLAKLSGDLSICKHPKTEVVHSIAELVEVVTHSIPLPVVVKGNYYKAYVVYHVESAISKATEIASEWGFPLLVQELVKGQEINLIGLSDREGNVVGRVSIKKQLTTHLGKVWTAVTIRDERMDALCDAFCKLTKWQGPFELECITNESGIYLIEINPRFPAWVYFATGVGVNLPRMLVELIENGTCSPKFDYPLGKYLVRYSGEFVSDLLNFERLLSTGNREGL